MTRSSVGLAIAVLLIVGAPSSAVADEPTADVCLEVASGTLTDAEWSALVPPVIEAIEARPAMFPAPTFTHDAPRIDIWAGRAGSDVGAVADCLEPGREWTTRFGREFLEAGADQMLAEAPTTPGIASSVAIEWYPDQTRLRTTLVFAGPFDIPNGTCWVDDALSLDDSSGTVVASGEQGVETSLFAESACGRFFEHLPDGGAGEQAVTMLPSSVSLADGGMLRFVVEQVDVRDDGVVVAGSLERD